MRSRGASISPARAADNIIIKRGGGLEHTLKTDAEGHFSSGGKERANQRTRREKSSASPFPMRRCNHEVADQHPVRQGGG